MVLNLNLISKQKTNDIDHMGGAVYLGEGDDSILYTDVNLVTNTGDTTLIVDQGALIDGGAGQDVMTVKSVDNVDVVESASIQAITDAEVEGFIRHTETINLTFDDAISSTMALISAEAQSDDNDSSGVIRMDVAHVDTDLEVVNLTSNEKRIELDDTIVPAIIAEEEDEHGRAADVIDNGWVQGDTTEFDLENFRDEIAINLSAYEVTGLSTKIAEGGLVMPNPTTDPTESGFDDTKVDGSTSIYNTAASLVLDNNLDNKGPRAFVQDDCETDVTVTVNMDNNLDLDDNPIDTRFTINLEANSDIVDPSDANYDVEIISVDTAVTANASDPAYYANHITVNVNDNASHAIELQDTFGDASDRYYQFYDVDGNPLYVDERDDTESHAGGTLISDVRTSLTVNTQADDEEIILKNVDADTITTTGASDIYLQLGAENNYTVTTGEGDDTINVKADTLRYDANWTLDANGNHVMTEANDGSDLIDDNDYIDGGAGTDTLLIAGGQDISKDIIENNIKNIENIEIRFEETKGGANIGEVEVNAVSTSQLEVEADYDMYAVDLEEGHTYTLEMKGADSSSGDLDDPYLYLYDTDGSTLITEDDDSGVEYDSLITYTPTVSGTYYLQAGAWVDDYTGTYTVAVTDSSVTTSGTDHNYDGELGATLDEEVASDLTIDSSHLDQVLITNDNHNVPGIADQEDDNPAVHIVNLDIYASEPVDAEHDTLVIDANIDTSCNNFESCNIPEESTIHSEDLVINIDAVDTDLDIRVNTAEGTTVNLDNVDQDERVEILATVSSIATTYVDGSNGGDEEGELMITSDTAALDKLTLIDEKTFTDCVLDGGEVTDGQQLVVTVDNTWADTALEIDATDIGNPLSDHSDSEAPTTNNFNIINGWDEQDAKLLIKSTNDNDLIHGGQKDDVIYGDRGDDIIIAGEGYDVVDGGSGDDRIYGGLDGDILIGESTDWINGESQDALETVGFGTNERAAQNTFVLGVREVKEGDGTAQDAIDESNSGLDGKNADRIMDFQTGLDTLEINLGEVFDSANDNVVNLGTYTIVDNPADGDDQLAGSDTEIIVGDSYYVTEDGKEKFVMDVDGNGDITTNDITVMSEGIINVADLDIQMETGDGDDLIRLGQSVDRIDAGADDDRFVLVGAIDEDDQATYLADLHDNNVMNSIEDLNLGNVVDPNELITLRDETEANAGDKIIGGEGNDILYVYGSADLTVMDISADIETLYVNSDVTLTEAQFNNFTTIEFGGSTEHVITVTGPAELSDFRGYIVTNGSTVNAEGTVLNGTADMAAYATHAKMVVEQSSDLPAIDNVDVSNDVNAQTVAGVVVSGDAVANSEVTLTFSNGRDEDIVVKVQTDASENWHYDFSTNPDYAAFVADFEGTVEVSIETMEGDEKVSTTTSFEVDTVAPEMTDVDGSVEEYVDPANPNVLTDAVVETDTNGDIEFSESDVKITKVVIGGVEYTTDFSNMVGDFGTLAIDGDAANGYTYTYTPNKDTIDALITGDSETDTYTVTYEDKLGNENTITSTIDMDITGADDIAEISGDVSGDAKEDDTTTVTGTITVEDPDLNPDGNGPIIGQQKFVSATAATYGTFTYDATDANGNSDWKYELDNASATIQSLGEGETLTDTITMTTEDGTTQDVVITITGTNDAPVVNKRPYVKWNTEHVLLQVSDVDTNDTLTFHNASGSINGMVLNNGSVTEITPVAQTTATTTNMQVTDGIAIVDLQTSYSEGSTGDDTFGSSTNDRIIFAFDGDDTVNASDEDDDIVGGAGADKLYGGAGDDDIHIDDADTVIDGGADYDIIELYEDVDVRLDTFKNNEAIWINEDNKSLSMTTDQLTQNNIDSVLGMLGDEYLKVYKNTDTNIDIDMTTVFYGQANFYYDVDGHTGDDTITGSTENDIFVFGDDLTNGDSLDGHTGNDTLKIGDDNAQTDLDGVTNIEKIEITNTASASDYKLSAGKVLIANGATLEVEHKDTGKDLKLDLSANAGNGILDFTGNDQKDEITAAGGDDELRGNAGGDELHGGDGSDHLYGGDNDDKLYGDAGEDTLEGGDNNDELHGGDDNDTLRGNSGVDKLYGDAGDDTIYVGDDSDIDTINYTTGTDGMDKIYEFDSGEDVYDTNFATTSTNYTFSGTYIAKTDNELDLDTSASKGVEVVVANTSATDMENMQNVIDLISNGSVKTESANDIFLMDIASADESSHYLYEVNDANGDQHVQNDELTLVGVFYDADLQDGDIV